MDVWHLDEHDDGRCRVKGRTVAVEPRFVDSAPGILEPGVMYVSTRHKTVLHLCACGCGHEVVTPLAPHRWRLVFDGETVSLEPSVSNGVLACRSHYIIIRNMIDWRRPMTEAGSSGRVRATPVPSLVHQRLTTTRTTTLQTTPRASWTITRGATRISTRTGISILTDHRWLTAARPSRRFSAAGG